MEGGEVWVLGRHTTICQWASVASRRPVPTSTLNGGLEEIDHVGNGRAPAVDQRTRSSTPRASSSTHVPALLEEPGRGAPRGVTTVPAAPSASPAPWDTRWVSTPAPVIVSACLAGIPCRYDGAAKPHPEVVAAVAQGRAVPLCAEVLGGLPTPRPPAEIEPGADGADVLAGRARVLTDTGEDVTAAFVNGAAAVARRAVELGARRAVLEGLRPSCGAGRVYDGTFSGTVREGDGVVAAALSEAGLDVGAR